MIKKLFIVFMFIAFSSLLCQVWAQEKPNGPFKKMDINKDEMISKDEFMAFHMEQAKKRGEMIFTKADTNGDGLLTKEEVINVLNAIKEKAEQLKNK
ncbi:MAG: EF-hand domain-containing protein [Candidatus Brocadiaceae bacterium]|nr:EF-hand domain-containing protein [Candidatus Brocadiaceae bacterium]